MTKCYRAWIVAVFCVLPILPLFNLQFCKVCLHFSYTCFSSAFSHLLATPAILPDNLCHLWHLFDFKRFFLAKTLAKTCHQCHKNGKSLIFKRIFIWQMRHELIKKCSSSNYYNVALLHAHAMLLYITMQPRPAYQKIKTVKKQASINYFKIF